MKGMYPLVAWRLDGRSTHLLEGRSNDVASAIHWAQSIGLMPAHDAAAPEGGLRRRTVNMHQNLLFDVLKVSMTSNLVF
uniref:Transposase n=1 Tax=Globodera pallida TaxID=36090 RepID=A0A183CAV0_GLOPA